jgi:hypothetical protein
MPKAIREGKLVDIAPAQLSEACRSELNNPAVTKMLVTSDLNGVPHSAPRNIAAVLDDEYPGCIAILEMIEGSQTSKNLLWSYDRQRTVAISTINPKTGESFLIKGIPHKYLYDGPLWLKFLNQAWEAIPTSEPAGVWVIIPTEERNENLGVRMTEEDTRYLPAHHLWCQYWDTRTAKRYGKK